MIHKVLTVVGAIAVGVLFSALVVEGQPAGKVYRVGVLHPATSPEMFLEELRQLGYIEGQNLIVDRRYADGKAERLPALAADLVRLKVDVIVATGGDAIGAAKRATTTIPVVMAFGPNPVERGFVASLARPGGNVTGVAYAADGVLVAKRLELLKETIPTARRIGMLDDGTPSFQRALKEAEAPARVLDVELVVIDARPGRYEQAFADMMARRVDALYAGGSAIHARDQKQLIALAARHRLPAIWEWRRMTDAGGLLSYGASLSALNRRVAVYVDRVLKGANPAEVPVEQPSAFELVINLKTAKLLGLRIPQSVLVRADHVIE